MLKSQYPLLVPTLRATAGGPTPQSHLICSALLQRLTAAEQAVFHNMMGAAVGAVAGSMMADALGLGGEKPAEEKPATEAAAPAAAPAAPAAEAQPAAEQKPAQ